MNTQSMTIPGFTNRIAYAKEVLRTLDPLDSREDALTAGQTKLPLLRDFTLAVANGAVKGDDARYLASLLVSELF